MEGYMLKMNTFFIPMKSFERPIINMYKWIYTCNNHCRLNSRKNQLGLFTITLIVAIQATFLIIYVVQMHAKRFKWLSANKKMKDKQNWDLVIVKKFKEIPLRIEHNHQENEHLDVYHWRMWFFFNTQDTPHNKCFHGHQIWRNSQISKKMWYNLKFDWD